jgi:hypothetical protein
MRRKVQRKKVPQAGDFSEVTPPSSIEVWEAKEEEPLLFDCEDRPLYRNKTIGYLREENDD